MAYNARVFTILVASPSDVAEERSIVTEVIQEWNDVYSENDGLVLLPVRWETHSSPELGDRPQAVINRQVVDKCDLLIGVFWTKLGTPTGVSESGTVEEIERFVAAGKPVMLYFSRAKIDIDSLEVDEIERLRKFKVSILRHGLVEGYSTLAEFKDKLRKQLVFQVRAVRIDDNGMVGDAPDVGSLRPVVICGDSGEILEQEEATEVELIFCTNVNEIPDYGEKEEEKVSSGLVTFSKNRDYYRQLVEYVKHQRLHVPLRMGASNLAKIGTRDVLMDVGLRADDGWIDLSESAPEKPDRSGIHIGFISNPEKASVLRLGGFVDGFQEARIEFPVIQGNRTVLSDNALFLKVPMSTIVRIRGTIYSSTLPPLYFERSINVRIRESRLSFREILAKVGESLGS